MTGSIPAHRLKRFLAKAMASSDAFFRAGLGVTICVPSCFDLPRYPGSAMPMLGTRLMRRFTCANTSGTL